MVVEETENGNLKYKDPLAKGVVLFPETKEELKYIEFLLEKETLAEFKNYFEIESKHFNREKV